MKQVPDESQNAILYQPVGQVFFLSESEKEFAAPNPESTSDQKRERPAGNSPKIQVQPAFPSILSVFHDIVLEQRKRFAILKAEPGAGKTLSFHYLAAELAKEYTSQENAIPIFIPLNIYSDRDDLLGYVRKTLSTQATGHRSLADNLEEVVASGRVVFLFDGLNEITDPLVQQKVFESIYDLSNKSNHVCLVSTRNLDEDLPALHPGNNHRTSGSYRCPGMHRTVCVSTHRRNY